MSNLATTDKPGQAVSTVQDYAGGLLEVIARAARDPSVDIDNMERLLEMQERVHARNAKQAYDAALAEMQPNLPVISERGRILNNNKQVQSTYAYWEDVNEHIRPILYEYGFALSFKTGRNDGMISVTGVLSHREGHREETTMDLPADNSGNKNAVQSIASSTSYGKRYTAFALLNITTKGEDDDGQTATDRKVDGEPMPRTKLDGKYSSKSKLQAALREFVAKLMACNSAEAVALLEAEYAEAIKQCQSDLPLWWTGDGTQEKKGVKRNIADKYDSLTADGFFGALIASMKECGTLSALGKWYAQNEDAIEALEDGERRQFENEYSSFEAGLELAAKVHN